MLTIYLPLYEPNDILTCYQRFFAVKLMLDNGLPIDGKIRGRLVAKNKQGEELAAVAIPEFRLPAAGEATILLTKQPTGNALDVVVPTLADLIKTVPHTIEMTDIHAVSDENMVTTVNLGVDYKIENRYAFEAPLAFDKDAQIVYTDTITGLNDDLKHLSFKEINGTIDGYLKANADITNKIPVTLHVDGYGIDADGNEISSEELTIYCEQTVAPSDGEKPETTAIEVLVKPTTNDAIRRLDQIVFRVSGSATDEIYGIRLNAYKHSLTVKNLTITKHGQIVGDFN